MGQNANVPLPAPQTDADHSDAYLLRRYVRHDSQAAFAALVRRYGGLVRATCLREVDDPQLAEDAAQVVFLLLARKAPSLLRVDPLAGWLFGAARFSARNALRQERRRKLHEQEVIADMTQAHLNGPPVPSWSLLEPLLNAALASLRPHEQEVVLLRYLEGASWRETAARLGLAEDAAQKRGTRAVDKMRRFVNRQGLTLSLAALTALLSEEAARATPLPAAVVAGTVATVTGGGLSSPNVTSLYQGVLHTMKTTKIAAFGSLALAGTAGGLLWAQSAPKPQTPLQVLGQVRTHDGVSQVSMDYRDFADVQGQRNPSAPLRVMMTPSSDGHQMTSFVVAAPWHGFPPGQTFRDGAHIAADRAARKGQAAKLKAELRAWNLLLKESPVILTQADMEPQCQAHLSGMGGATPAISQTFTPSGTEKFAQFTKDHTGGVVGIIINDRILSAPVIMAPIRDSHAEIIGGFASLNEARVLADRLNDSAGGGQRKRK